MSRNDNLAGAAVLAAAIGAKPGVITSWSAQPPTGGAGTRGSPVGNQERQHATIGLSSGGWVRDEHSTNGTYVNGSPVAAGEMVDLAEGAELRLASNVRADVRLYRPGEASNG